MIPVNLKPLMLFLGLAMLVSGSAGADEQAERNIGVLAKKMQALDAVSMAETLVADVDIDRTAKFVLGRHLHDVAPADLSAFTGRFERYLTSVIESRADEISDGEIQILNSYDRNDHDCVVSTSVRSATREPTIMRWRLIRSEGAWYIVDVEMHGVWLAIEQRAQIDSLLDASDDISEIYPERTS